MTKSRPESAVYGVHCESLEARMLLSDVQVGTVVMPYDGYLSAGIYDSNGQLVSTLLSRAPEQAGNVTLTWNGVDNQGRMVNASGTTFTWKALISQVEAVDEGAVGDSLMLPSVPLSDAPFFIGALAVNNVGGMSGEVGGKFVLTDSETYYADTTLSQSYSLTTALSGSGDFYASDFETMGSSTTGGARLFVGHFSQSTADNHREFMGLEFQPGDGSDRIGIRAMVFSAGGGACPSPTYLNIMTGSGVYHYTYSYDPTYDADPAHPGAEGRLTVRIYNDYLSVDQTMYAPVGNNARDQGATFDAFGMGIETNENGPGDDPNKSANVVIDNVTYSGNTGTVDFTSDPGWVGHDNTSNSNNFGWSQYNTTDGSLYSVSLMEENVNKMEKFAQDGSFVWLSNAGNNTGTAVDDKYIFVTKHEENQDRLYRYYARDGANAPFGTYPAVPYIVINSNAPDPWPSNRLSMHTTAEEWRTYAACWGMAADGYRVWVSNYRTNTVAVYDRNTGVQLATYSVTKPLGIAFDSATPSTSVVWLSNNGDRVTKLTYNGSITPSTVIPSLSDPTGLAIGGPSHHLFVAEAGSTHIHEYDISGTPALAGLGTFGSKQTGIDLGDSTFDWSGWGNWSSIAVDPTGILSVNDDHRVQRFYTTGQNAGGLYNSIFSEWVSSPVQTFNYGSNGTHYLYSGRYTYEVDPSWAGGPRPGWLGDGTWRATQRIQLPRGFENSSPVLHRTINGHDLAYFISGNTVLIYTLTPTSARLSAVIGANWNGPDFMTKSLYNDSGNGIGGRYNWTDADGDGVIDGGSVGSGVDGEVTWNIPYGTFSGLTGFYAPWVDNAGSIWYVDCDDYGNQNITKVPLDSFDGLGNPIYDWAHKQTVVPYDGNDGYGFVPFTIRIDGNGDIWALGGCRVAVSAEWGGWSNGADWIAKYNSAGVRQFIAPTLDRTYCSIAIDNTATQSGYYFTGDEAWINMFSNDGLLVEQFVAGPASGGPNGWIDQAYGLGAFTNPVTGQLYVYAEEDWYGKSDRYRIDNTSTIQRQQGGFTYTNPADLTGHWEFNNNLNDTAGSTNGTSYGGTSYVPGWNGNALSLDGVDDYVNIPYTADFTGYTISARIKVNAINNANIICRTDSNGYVSDQIRIDNGKFEHVTIEGAYTTKTVTGTTSISTGTWYNVVITASNNGMMRLYVDGVEQGTAQSIGTLWVRGDHFLIGKAMAGTVFFNGVVDDLRITPFALSASDIADLKNGVGVALPKVTAAATDSTAAEQYQDRGAFTIRRDGSVGNLTVYYSLGGTASGGTDYSTVSTSVVIADGQTSATVTVTPIDDGSSEGQETITLTLSTNAAYRVGTANVATINLVDNEYTVVAPNGHWSFENNLGDYVGHNDGICHPIGYFPWVSTYAPGRIGEAVDLVNYYDHVEIPYANDATAYSISLWVKPDTASNAVIFARTDGSDVSAIVSERLRIYNGHFEHYTYDGAGKTVTSTTTVVANTWYHLVIVGSNNGMERLYVNGTEEGTAVSLGTLWTGGSGFLVGRQSLSYVSEIGLSGLVDDLQVFDAPLTAAQVSVIYAQTGTVSVVATDASAAEQGADTGTFRIARIGTSGDITVNYTIGGTATSGADFSALAGSVVIANGQSSATVTVTPIDDSTGEPNETVVLTLTSGTGYTVGAPNSDAVTIADNEPVLTVTASDPNAAEPSDTGTFTVTRTTSSGALTVYYTVSGTATSGTDFSSLGSSVVIANGQTSAVVTVTPINDSSPESTETVVLTLTTNAAYTVGSPSNATVNIADDESTVTVAATDPNATETGSDTGTFTVTRTATSGNLTVYYTLSGSATNGTDYSTLSGSVVISSGQSSATVALTPINDSSVEGTETATLTISTNANYAVGSPSNATVSIADDDNVNNVSYVTKDLTHKGSWKGVYGSAGYNVYCDSYSYPTGLTVTPGSGTGTYVWANPTTDVRALQKAVGSEQIAACLYSASTFTLTVNFDTARQFAIYSMDWNPLGRAMTVDALDGSTLLDSRSVSAADTAGGVYLVYRASGTITFRFTYTGAGGGNSTISGIFFDPDSSQSTVSITPGTNAAEPSTNGTFVVSRTGSTTSALTVNYAVDASSTATSGSDYTALGTSVVIPAGQASTTIALQVKDDSTSENTETVVVNLASGSGYTIGTPSATVNILDDDAVLVNVTASDASAAESPLDSGTFIVSRLGGSLSSALTVTYGMSGSATSGQDYTALGTVIIPANQASVAVTLTPINDSDYEATETATLTVQTGSGYTPGGSPIASINITSDDPLPTVSISPGTNAAEPSTNGTFVVTRTGGTTNALTVNYAVDGSSTATSGSDYTALGTSVVIPAGQASTTIALQVNDDSTSENTETVVVNLASGSGYTIGTTSATVNILDNDAVLVNVSASDASAAESPLDTGTFIVSRLGSLSSALTVTYGMSGSATSGQDYTALGTVVIPANQASVVVTLTPVNDTDYEATETATLTVQNGTGYTAGASPSASISITSDDSSTVSPYGRWLFEGNLNDAAGSKNGTFVQGSAVYDPAGWSGSAIDLSGSSNYFQILDSVDPTAYTISAWIKADTVSAENIITRSSGDVNNSSHQLRINASGKFEHSTYDGAVETVTGTTTVVAGTWYHVAITASNSGMVRLYVNGKEEGTAVSVGTLWTGGDRWLVGSNNPMYSLGFFDGKIDDLRVYQQALTASQIRDIADPACGQWKLDGDLSDSAGLIGAGTIVNGPANYATGRAGSAIDLNGSTQYLNIADATNPTAYTITAWVKPDVVSGAVNIITRSSGDINNSSHQIRINASGKFEHSTYDGSIRTVTGTTTVVANTWYFVAITASNNGTMRLYVNGQEEGTALSVGTMWTGGNCWLVGSNNPMYSLGFFDGKIDDLRVYRQVLSQADIVQVGGFVQDGFESGNGSGGTGWGGNWSTSGNVAFTNSGTPQNGTYHMQLTGNNGVASRAVNMSGVTAAHLVFDWKANSFEAGETAVVEIYNGTSWITVQTISDGQDDNAYHHSDIDLSSYSLSGSFQVRFRSLMSATDDYFYVDNVFITKN